MAAVGRVRGRPKLIVRLTNLALELYSQYIFEWKYPLGRIQ
jgi:hypothetical protein